MSKDQSWKIENNPYPMPEKYTTKINWFEKLCIFFMLLGIGHIAISLIKLIRNKIK